MSRMPNQKQVAVFLTPLTANLYKALVAEREGLRYVGAGEATAYLAAIGRAALLGEPIESVAAPRGRPGRKLETN